MPQFLGQNKKQRLVPLPEIKRIEELFLGWRKKEHSVRQSPKLERQ